MFTGSPPLTLLTYMMSQMKQHQSKDLYGYPIVDHETKQLDSCPLQISQHFKDWVPPILQLKESKCIKEAQSCMQSNIFN